jgi:hypothetical protein
MPKIVEDDGFVISWGPRSKKECDELWAQGLNSAPVSSPSLSLSTKEMRSKKGPNSTPASSPSLPSSKKLLRSEKRADPRWEGDTGLAGLLESD